MPHMAYAVQGISLINGRLSVRAGEQEGAIVTVDVTTEIVIDRPVSVVAAYATDPTNAPTWYANIGRWSGRPHRRPQVGSQVAFVARSSAGAWSTRTSSPRSSPVSAW